MNTIRLRFSFAPLRVLNSSPIIGIEPRIGTRFSLSRAVSRDQAAEHDHAAVVDQHRGRDRALVGDQVDRALRALRDAGVFLLDLEHHRVAFVDLRRDLEDRADFLALDGLERIDLALLVRRRRCS